MPLPTFCVMHWEMCSCLIYGHSIKKWREEQILYGEVAGFSYTHVYGKCNIQLRDKSQMYLTHLSIVEERSSIVLIGEDTIHVGKYGEDCG